MIRTAHTPTFNVPSLLNPVESGCSGWLCLVTQSGVPRVYSPWTQQTARLETDGGPDVLLTTRMYLMACNIV